MDGRGFFSLSLVYSNVYIVRNCRSKIIWIYLLIMNAMIKIERKKKSKDLYAERPASVHIHTEEKNRPSKRPSERMNERNEIIKRENGKSLFILLWYCLVSFLDFVCWSTRSSSGSSTQGQTESRIRLLRLCAGRFYVFFDETYKLKVIIFLPLSFDAPRVWLSFGLPPLLFGYREIKKRRYVWRAKENLAHG